MRVPFVWANRDIRISSESTSVATLDQLSHDLSTIASSIHLRRSNVVADPALITEVAPQVYKCLDRFVPGTARATGYRLALFINAMHG